MKVLVVGSGGREHALVWKIAQSSLVKKVYCAPGNAGTANSAENIDIPPDNIEALLQFATIKGILADMQMLLEEHYTTEDDTVTRL